MLKKSLLLATVMMSQMAFASPTQYQNINKSYELSCQTNNNGKDVISELSLKGDVVESADVLILNTSLLGQYDITLPLKDQKVLKYKSDDSFPKTYNYVETKYPLNEIFLKETVKAGIFGREGLQYELRMKFADRSLSKGSLKLITYWPKKNNVTICSIKEK